MSRGWSVQHSSRPQACSCCVRGEQDMDGHLPTYQRSAQTGGLSHNLLQLMDQEQLAIAWDSRTRDCRHWPRAFCRRKTPSSTAWRKAIGTSWRWCHHAILFYDRAQTEQGLNSWIGVVKYFKTILCLCQAILCHHH